MGTNNDPNLIPDELRNVWIQTVLSHVFFALSIDQMNLRKAGGREEKGGDVIPRVTHRGTTATFGWRFSHESTSPSKTLPISSP